MQCCNVIDAISTVSHCVAQPLQHQFGSARGQRQGARGAAEQGALPKGCGLAARSIRFLKVCWLSVAGMQERKTWALYRRGGGGDKGQGKPQRVGEGEEEKGGTGEESREEVRQGKERMCKGKGWSGKEGRAP